MYRRLLLIAVGLLLPLLSFAVNFTVDGIKYETTSTNKVQVISNSYSGSIVIPESVEYSGETYTVSAIGDSAFYNLQNLISISIPNSVTIVGNSAFGNCAGLTKAEFGSIESLCNINFKNWNSNPLYYAHHLYIDGDEITELEIPSSVTSIGNYAFSGCKELTSLIIPNSVVSIRTDAFEGCSGLTKLTIPNSVTSLGYSAFARCSGLIELSLPNSLTTIGMFAFYGCSSLLSVTIPNSVTTIEEHAFFGCGGLKEVTIPNSVLSIEYGAFCDCVGLKEVVIPNSVTNIGSFAFGDLPNLTEVTIPASVTEMGSFAFGQCYNLKKVIFEDGETPLLVDGGFWHCTGLKEVYLGRSLCDTESVSFGACYSLSSLTIGSSVDSIGENVFSHSILTNIVVNAEVPPVISENSFPEESYSCARVVVPAASIADYKKKWSQFVFLGVPTDGLLNKTYAVSSPGDLSDMVSADELEKISEIKLTGKINGTDIRCLNRMVNLMSLDLSECDIVSGGEAYYEEEGKRFETKDNTLSENWAYNLRFLSDLKLPSTLATIGKRAFDGKYQLSNFSIPNSVTAIEDSAFIECVNLTEIIIPNSVKTIGNEAFEYCFGLEKVVISDSVTAIGNRIFSNCYVLTDVHIGNSVATIGNRAFVLCRSLTQITIPNSVTTIDDYGFSNCYGLTDLNLSNSLTTIGSEAFAFCHALTKVSIPNSVTKIDRYAFASSENLTEVTVGNSVATIGGGAFQNCNRLTSISISGPITELPEDVFWSCWSLKDVTLPGSVRKISATAFKGCSALTGINVINPIPAVIESETFSACEASATLNVPAGSIEAYKAHPYWGKFNAIATWDCGGSENFMVDNVTYHVLLDGSVEIAAVSAPAARSVSGVIEIPDKVVSDGVSYRVGGVANGGFNGAGYAALVLPSTIGYVGLEAFKECTALTEITCMSQVPPSVGDNSFDEDAYGSVKLIVPEDAVEAYRAHDVWQKFDVLAAKILVTSIVLDPSSWNGNVGDKFHIEATVLPEDARNQSRK